MKRARKTDDETANETVWFGDEPTTASDKTERVGALFNQVAGYYDLMNDVMSLGLHRLWKQDFIRGIHARAGAAVLDLAGGTGDIARGLQKNGAAVTICDLSEQMVSVGRDRALDKGIVHGIDYTVGNGETLPFQDGAFDHVTIAFGLRNVTHINLALQEAHRVLKPGGRFHCLEFSQVEAPMLAKIYDLYSQKIIPNFGKFVANDAASYEYLVESIRRFPDQETLVQMMDDAGFRRTRFRNLSGGIVAVHSGLKA